MSATSLNVAKLVVCIKNTGYEVSLERRKMYSILPDPKAKKHKMLRVVDESGEDYLFPEGYFLSVALPPAVRQALLAAAKSGSQEFRGRGVMSARGQVLHCTNDGR